MTSAAKALTERIQQLRRRHFGPRGKAEFARRLNVPAREYERYERGTVPPGDVLVRMCETTGEDLQWLLTGVAARGTVVIAGARHRHQDLLARLAQLLDGDPKVAAPLEAFVELLVQGGKTRAAAQRPLPIPAARDLIPIFENDDAPDGLPAPAAQTGAEKNRGLARLEKMAILSREAVRLLEPAMAYAEPGPRPADLIRAGAPDGPTRRFLHSSGLVRCFPGAFGVRLADDTMKPMFLNGDAVLVAVGAEPQIGRPALCKLANERGARCRIWLGQDETHVHLGRLTDGEQEDVARQTLAWSLEVLYRLAA